MMKEKRLQLVTFEQAKKLKALNFDWDICRYDNCYSEDGDIEDYNGDNGHWDLDVNHSDTSQISAPTVALALKWIRDEKDIYNAVNFFDVITPYYEGWYQVNHLIDVAGKRLHPRTTYTTDDFKSYEDAESVLLDELLTILEEKQ